MDQFTHKLEPFPLLTSHTDYFPDTQDLSLDTDAREYWLQCFEDALDKVTNTNPYLFRNKGVARGVLGCPWPPLLQAFFNQTT